MTHEARRGCLAASVLGFNLSVEARAGISLFDIPGRIRRIGVRGSAGFVILVAAVLVIRCGSEQPRSEFESAHGSSAADRYVYDVRSTSGYVGALVQRERGERIGVLTVRSHSALFWTYRFTHDQFYSMSWWYAYHTLRGWMTRMVCGTTAITIPASCWRAALSNS